MTNPESRRRRRNDATTETATGAADAIVGPLTIRYVRLRDAVLWDGNPKRHDMGGIIQSIREHGFRDAPIYDGTLGAIVAGNGRTTALMEMFEAGDPSPAGVVVHEGDWWMPMQFGLDAASVGQAKAFGVDHNLLTATGGDLGFPELVSLFDHDRLVAVLQDAAMAGAPVFSLDPDDLDALLQPPPVPGGGDGGGDGSGAGGGGTPDPETAGRTLAERFLVPPFSVLDARAGYWQERKRAWIGLGIRSEEGRGGRLAYAGGGIENFNYHDRPDTSSSMALSHGPNSAVAGGGTSIFDPVLCEVVYTWFCPPGGTILDPFAGGSVRGIVASRLGRRYVGVELRAEQVAANEAQAAELCRPGDPVPRWIVGDSRNIAELVAEDGFDLVFTCPPYGDLERYSDDPADLSTMSWQDFRPEYRRCIAGAIDKLAADRFAVVVVGDFRETNGGGFYRGFPEYTTEVMDQAGARKYNEVVFVTAAGSLPVRVGRQFVTSRKAGKTHQNVLVAVKGRPRAAADACGPVEVDTTLLDGGDDAGDGCDE